MSHRDLKWFALVVTLIPCSVILSACGGGGGEGDTTLRGVFRGPHVAGLPYETHTHSGVTDAQGGFLYEPGESVLFRLGDTTLGLVDGAPEVSLIDLIPGFEPPTSMERAERLLYPSSTLAHDGRLVNLLVLLHTLDEDEDAGNGIQIPAILLPHMDGVALDLTQIRYNFPEDPALRTVLAEGVGLGLWGGLGKGVAPAPRALQTLYDDLGIPTTFWRLARATWDTDGNGSIDSGRELRFGGEGLASELRYDDDGDGTVDRVVVRSYDRLTHVVEETSDTGLDGVDRRTRWSYDKDGFFTGWTRDDDDDGTLDYRSELHRTALGWITMGESDWDGDGTWDGRETYMHDASGNPILAEYDDGADGSIDERTAAAFNARRQETHRREDDNADGIWDYLTEFEYDAKGRQTRRREDNNADGVWDRETTYTYDAAGNLARIARDDGVDGSIDRDVRTTYNEMGDRIRSTIDEDGNGMIDRITTYIRASNGDLLEQRSDDDGDGVIDTVTRYFYDAEGLRTGVQRDIGNDGTLDYIAEYVPIPGTWFNVGQRGS